MNRALLLEFLRQDATITRSDLARRSALAKPTVSSIIDALIDEGVVCEIGPGASRSRGGPRGRLLSLNADAAAFVGILIGVGQTSLAVADGRGRIRAAKTVTPFRDDAVCALGELPDLVGGVMREAQLPRGLLRGVGIAVPGLVNHATGMCVLAPNLGWRDVPLRSTLTEAFRVPVAVRNSMQAGAIAEARLGADKRPSSFAWVYVGSGIGAAIVIDGRVFYGRRGYTGEIGHLKVVDDGALCGCGRRGCLETVASNRAIEAAARALRTEAVPTGVAPAPLDAQSIAVAASRGDASARSILKHAGEHVGVGISYLLNLLDLEMVVLDGPVIRAGDCFIETIRTSVARHTMDGQGIPIVKSTVSDDVMLKGAVFLAMDGDLVDRVAPELDPGEAH